jgi:hypothetical protein
MAIPLQAALDHQVMVQLAMEALRVRRCSYFSAWLAEALLRPLSDMLNDAGLCLGER